MTNTKTYKYKFAQLLFSGMMVFLLLSGCVPKGEQFKEISLAALEYYTQLSSYGFEGSGVVHIPVYESDNSDDQMNILDLLQKASWSWKGIADFEAQRMDIKVGVAPEQSDLSMQIPVILTSDILYIKLPAWNTDESAILAVNLPDDIKKRSIQKYMQLFPKLLTQVITPLHPKYFTLIEEDEKLKRISIPIDQNTVLPMLKQLEPNLEDILALLQEFGLIQTQQAELWLDTFESDAFLDKIKTIQLPEEGYITFTVQDQNQLLGVSIKLVFQFGEDPSSLHRLEWDTHFSNHNEQMEFSEPIPDQAIELDDILTSQLLTKSKS